MSETKMTVNPAIERLGFKETDRVMVLHVDDVGMCGASLDAFDDLWADQSVSCGSVMVPCPWFRATAEWSRAHPDADLGVHATLTSLGVPLIDRVLQLSLTIEDVRPQKTRELLDKLHPGQIGYALFHPALDSAEIRAICPDWVHAWRIMNFSLAAS